MNKEKGPAFLIGYKKPPRQTQFKRGRSGNPSGRPKGKATTFAESFKTELNTRITVNEGGKQRQITKLQAIAKQQTNKAVNGDLKATALLLKAIEPRESEQIDNPSPLLHAMRAIHAKHEAADQNAARIIAVSDLAGNSEDDDNDSD